MNIYKKILAVQQEAETIPKSGYNAFNKYKYSTEADVLAVKDLMNKHGLVAFPDTVGYETLTRGDQIQVLLHVEYTVVDADTGESIKVKVVGQGEDKGDKGSYKAATGANKYFYLKFAGCATGDDPERSDEQPKQKTQSKPQLVKETPAPATSPTLKAILNLQKQYDLSNEAIMDIAKIKTLKGLSEPQLQEVYDCIHFSMQEAK
jgi:hypothetical protein